MALDDEVNNLPTELDDERRRKLLSLIVGSSIKPVLPTKRAPGEATARATPPSAQELFGRPPALSPFGTGDRTVWGAPAPSGVIPGTDLPRPSQPGAGSDSRPRLPASRAVPVTPPTFPNPTAPPSILGGAAARPARPSGPPLREDYPAEHELGGWKKYLALGLASLAPREISGSLVENILHGQRDKAESKYEQAEKDYESQQGDEERAARIQNIRSEIKTRETPNPENLDREAYDFYVMGGMSPAEARKQVLKDAAETKLEKPDTATQEDQRYENIQTSLSMKKPVSAEDSAWAKAYEKRKTLAPALTANIKAGEQGTARSDKSYTFHAGRIDALRKPVEERAERIARVEDTLRQGTPQADALIAPELLSVMAGGAGSGVRQNEAELARIVGGRTNWETLKAKINAWQLDPNKGFSLTPAQREQTRALFSSVKDRVSRKMQAIDEESSNLLNTDDPKEHRSIYQRLQKRLGEIDTGKAGGGQIQVTDPNGGVHTFPDQASADRFKKLAGIR